MSEAPYFSEKLLQCDSAGTHTPFSSKVSVKFYGDRIKIGRLTVYLPYIKTLQHSGNVLNIAYVQADGTVLARYFRYDSFLPGTAPKKLGQAIGQAGRHIDALPEATLEAARQGVDQSPEIVTAKTDGRGRVSVQVKDPVVLFPLTCPRCGNEATTVDLLRTSTLFNQQMTWIVPTCDAHPQVGGSIAVKKWDANQSGVEFSFRNASYADEFQKLNRGEVQVPSSSRLSWEIERGTRFLVFKYAVSAVYIATVNTSKVHKIEPGKSAARAAFPYTLLSFVAGWWSLPGPIMTVRAIRANLKGGVDLTQDVRALVAEAGEIH